MTQSKKIAVTGGIGSGKSTVLSLLKERGFPVFSCDEIYAELSGEREYLDMLACLFPDYVKKEGLDRKALSKLVFSDGKARKALNDLSHPLIMRRLLERMEPFPLSFAEVPLLFEGGYEALFDGMIVLRREKAARIAAVRERSGLSEEEVLARMENQFDYRDLPEGCFVLDNDGPVDELRRRLDLLLTSPLFH